MPAEAAVHWQRSFEIDQRTDAGKLQVCPFPRFAQQIELKQLLSRARNQLHEGKTAAVQGQAVADLQSTGADFRAHDQLNRPGRRLNAFDGASFFDNACEHKQRAPPACRLRGIHAARRR